MYRYVTGPVFEVSHDLAHLPTMFVLMGHTDLRAQKLRGARVWPSAFLGCPIYNFLGTQMKAQQSHRCS